MAIEVTESAIVVTGEHIRMWDLLGFRTLLGLEIRTGMPYKNGFSLVKAAVKRGYVPEGVRKKTEAYDYVNRLAVSLGAEDRPTP